MVNWRIQQQNTANSSICIRVHVQKQMSKILVQIFCFVAILLGSKVSTPLFSFDFMSLLLQIVKSRISLIVLSVFIKVKIVHYLHFQLKQGK